MKIPDCTVEDLKALASGGRSRKRSRLVEVDEEEDPGSPELHQLKDAWNSICVDYSGMLRTRRDSK